MSYLDIQAVTDDFEETDPLLPELDDEIDPDMLEDETQSQQLAIRSCYRSAVLSMADER